MLSMLENIIGMQGKCIFVFSDLAVWSHAICDVMWINLKSLHFRLKLVMSIILNNSHHKFRSKCTKTAQAH